MDKGFHQAHGFNFNETFSSVINPITNRLIIILALANNWQLFHLDVNNSFLNDFLKRSNLHDAAPGFEVGDRSLVWKLN